MSGQFQGDIILTEQQKIELKNGVTNPSYRWPNNQLIVDFDPSISSDQQNRVAAALNTITSGTCMSWRRRNGDSNYVYVTKLNTGCWSYVGRIGGRQDLNLQDPGCWSSGTVVHEFLHAWGFHHMQCDNSRDDFVWIYWDNIQEANKHNFDIQTATTSYGVPYDYDSVMHYGPYSFAINTNEPTILRNREPYYQLGNNNGPTASDLAKARAMYC